MVKVQCVCGHSFSGAINGVIQHFWDISFLALLWWHFFVELPWCNKGLVQSSCSNYESQLAAYSPLQIKMAIQKGLHEMYTSLQVKVKALSTQWSFWGLLSLLRYLQTVLAFSCFMLWMWVSSLWSSSSDRCVSSSRNRFVTEPFGDPVEF